MSMGLGHRLEQTMSMQLTFAQKLSLEILQLNAQNLELKIAEELEKNPLLDVTEGTGQELATDGDEPSLDEKANIEAMMDVFEPVFAEGNDVRSSSPGDDDDFDPLTLLQDESRDFDTTMEDQLRFLNLVPEDHERVMEILSRLDERGYLVEGLEEVAGSEDADHLVDWVRALRVVQEELEPPGLGARDLKECLLLQLWRLGSDFQEEADFLDEQFEHICENRLDQASEDSGLPMERVREMMDFYRTLTFQPAMVYHEEAAEALRLDAIIRYDPPDLIHQEGRFRILLAREGRPELEVTPSAIYKQEELRKEERQYLATHHANAKALIEAIRRRDETLTLTIMAICKRQLKFFEEGRNGLEPLQMQEIAKDLDVSAATVTRTVKDKVVHTDHGTFELRYFFSKKKVRMGDGGVAKREDLLNALKALVDGEDKRKPLSDSLLSKQLLEKGHKVAVRTISKYRDMMNIPSSSKRKQF